MTPTIKTVFALAASALLLAVPVPSAAQSASVTIRIEVDNADGAPAFSLQLPGETVSLAPGESTTVTGAPDDQLRLVIPETEGYRVMGADCRRMPGGGQAAIRSDPDRSLFIETGSNPNADAMAEAWPAIMQTAGKARCGESEVRFFSTPGSDPTGLTGGVRFHLRWAGAKYDGAATFSCDVPGGWLRLRDQFINTFHNNDGTTFDGR